MSKEVEFVDIMEPRRAGNDKFSFMTKYWNPQKSYILHKCYSPQDLKDIVANSVYIDSMIEMESLRTGIRKEKLKVEVLDYLEEMGLDKKVYVIRWLGVLFLKISLMMKIKVFVNESAVLQLKSGMGKNPVLFLPTHRSYADFCLLTYLCFHYNIDFPAVAAGMDFYSMAVLGRRMRESCAFYIRRTLTGRALYAATLRRYVRALVTGHSAPIEFFVEGTRSRTNKSLPPKYGMLSMALMPLFAGEVSDITIVPINISYDRLMEQYLFAYELLGVPKPKESTGGFIKALNSLNDHFGNIYINFGTPLSVREYIKGVPLLSEQTLYPVDLQQLTPQQFGIVQDIANHVVTLHQKSTVITISNLLALVSMHYIMAGEPLAYDELVTEVDWMIGVLRGLGASVFEDDVSGSLNRILLVHNKLLKVDKDRRLRLVCPPVNLTDDNKKKIKGHILKAETMRSAVPLMQLQLYVNPVLHYLVPPALLCVLLARPASRIENLESEFHKIRGLLKHEYFYSEKNDEFTFKNTMNYCWQHSLIAQRGDAYISGGAEKLRFLLAWSIWPALTVVAKCMDVMIECVRCPAVTIGARVQAACERVGAPPLSLAHEAGAGAARALCGVGALLHVRGDTDDCYMYEVMPEVMEEYHKLIASVLPHFDVDFSTNNPVILYEVSTTSRL